MTIIGRTLDCHEQCPRGTCLFIQGINENEKVNNDKVVIKIQENEIPIGNIYHWLRQMPLSLRKKPGVELSLQLVNLLVTMSGSQFFEEKNLEM